jgi:hypothetical protein
MKLLVWRGIKAGALISIICDSAPPLDNRQYL